MIIKIYDDIMSKQMAEWCGGFSLATLDARLEEMKDDDPNLDLEIHSNGGDVFEGWAIIDKLRSTGKVITSNAYGLVASMALTIYLAGSRRIAPKGATFLAHYPFVCHTDGTAEDIQKTADELKAEQDKLLDFYCERTGCDREKMDALMAEDRIITAEEAKEYGFIHEISEPLSASGRGRGEFAFKKPIYTVDMNKSNSMLAQAFKALGEALGLGVKIENEAPEVQNYVLVTEDGTELTIDKPEGEDPAVGDTASPDGSHEMPDGRTIVVTDGVITEIIPATDDAPETEDKVDEKDTLIADLQSQLDALKAENEELRKAKADGEKAKKDLADLRSKYNVAKRNNAQKLAATKAVGSNNLKDEIEASRKRIKESMKS